MVKARSDVLKGRSGRALTPLDLFENKNINDVGDRKKRLQETLDTLGNFKVPIPQLVERGGHTVMRVQLVPELATVPDPLLVALKAAINWSSFRGHKLLPTFSDVFKVDPDEAELY